jgi:DNA-binding MltR family transcriptional regulator
MEILDAAIKAATDAYYNATLNFARNNIDQLQFDPTELPIVFRRLRSESETAQVLVFASYLEDRITALIRARLHNVHSGKAADNLFGTNGPLNTLGNRITLAFHLGWIADEQKQKLNAFRKLRNEFAHNAFKCSFSDVKVAGLSKAIDYNLRMIIKPMPSVRIDESPIPLVADDEILPNVEILCNLAILAWYTFRDLLVLPTSILYQVNPNDLHSSFDRGDNVIANLSRAGIRAVLELLETEDSRKSAI